MSSHARDRAYWYVNVAAAAGSGLKIWQAPGKVLDAREFTPVGATQPKKTDVLVVAATNAETLGAKNVAWIQSDWFTALAQRRFHLIASNPPYVAAGDKHLTQGDVRFEPAIALSPGPSGLEALEIIVTQSLIHLHPGGWLLLEHGHDQAQSVRKLLRARGYDNITSERDIAGIERISYGQAPG